MKPIQVTDKVFMVAGANLTDYRDGAVYLIDLGAPVLIDSGSGFGFDKTVKNIEYLGFNPYDIPAIILTHCHFDHVGGAHLFKQRFETRLIMHELDARIVERADQRLTAAFCFDVEFKSLPIDEKLNGEESIIVVNDHEIVCTHTPGHTPGSISVYIDLEGERILFAQDIGAPLLKEFDCDSNAWVRSIDFMFYLNPDILCDGHSGIFKSKEQVREYLQYCISKQIEMGYL
ncbi:MAG TPA: MBL fold metallo-hydrolase [Syntrophorhabdaceae bacterium]|nr:MBL fold metallo-hydrolase [Syntrophorhabdaceae bacterium]